MWKYEIISQQIKWENFFLRSQLYAQAYERIWTQRPCCLYVMLLFLKQ